MRPKSFGTFEKGAPAHVLWFGKVFVKSMDVPTFYSEGKFEVNVKTVMMIKTFIACHGEFFYVPN